LLAACSSTADARTRRAADGCPLAAARTRADNAANESRRLRPVYGVILAALFSASFRY